MSSPFVAEIRIFGCNFAPTGWATCDGQLLPLSQNTALFSLLGTFYGGDGKSTFALPNLQGSVALNQGQLQGGSEYFLGQQSGTETVTLLQTEIPIHTHLAMADGDDDAESNVATDNVLGRAKKNIFVAAQSPQAMQFQELAVTGSSFPHNNLMPYLVMNMCIAMQGVFPPRS